MTLGIIGDEWTIWIVQLALGAGVTRYNDWLRAGPISSSVLTARLTRLVEHDILRREPSVEHPRRYEYRLTARGRQLWPILLAMWTWERHWVPSRDDPLDPLPAVLHTRCGRFFEPYVLCDACGERTEPRDVRAGFGPSGTWQRSIPSAATRRRASSDPRPIELVPQTMAVIGNRWSAALLNCAFLGATRFGEFAQQTGAPPTVVADRLRTFGELDLLARAPNPSRSDWSTYHLTRKGLAFFPVLAQAVEWGQRWFRSPEGKAIEQRHTACGADFHPRLACDQCDGRLSRRDLEVPSGTP